MRNFLFKLTWTVQRLFLLSPKVVVSQMVFFTKVKKIVDRDQFLIGLV